MGLKNGQARLCLFKMMKNKGVMMLKKASFFHVVLWVILGMWSVQAYAFTTAEVYEAILTADKKHIVDVQEDEGYNNRWHMKFLAKTADKEDEKSHEIGIPTMLKYAGSRIHIEQVMPKVDVRVVDVVLNDSDATSQIENLQNYDAMMSDLSGFQGEVSFDGKRMNFKGSVSVAGKTLDEVKSLLKDLREETADLYYEIDKANQEALADYFEQVLNKDYAAIVDAQVFVEVLGHGFSKQNQVGRKDSKLGHWQWKVDDIDVETVNYGRYFEERLWLNTGDLSEYKQEKMYADLRKRVLARLPKGAKSAKILAHPHKQGITIIVLEYPLDKEPSGEDIRNYHEKFIDYVRGIYPSLRKITHKYTADMVTQAVKTLSARDFMALMNDGLEGLPQYEAQYADGQWKFKYKGVAYIITNYKTYMELSLIKNVAKGHDIDDAIGKVEDYIERNFPNFADKYEIVPYKNSKRTLWVKMRFNYGLMNGSDVKGEKLKEEYLQFTNDIGPELQAQI